MIMYEPKVENDSMFISIENLFISEEDKNVFLVGSDYAQIKFDKFENKNRNPADFYGFTAASLSNIKKLRDLSSTIYTFSAQNKNGMKLEDILSEIKLALQKNPNSRRMLLRFANPVKEYLRSEKDGNVDISCLLNIHYRKDGATMIFRALDLKDEFLLDLLTLYWFFLKPVYEGKINIKIFASTVQNIDCLKDRLGRLHENKFIS
jgi:hypothetical protein